MKRGHIPAKVQEWFPDDWGESPEPQVDDWLTWVWRAWHRLSFDRPIHGGGLGPAIPGRIPWRMVAEWADYHGQDSEFLDKAVLAMDEVYLAWCAAQRV